MAYSEEVKQKILNRIENGDKIKDISEETGISIPTLYNWRNKANLSKENQGKGETNKSTNIEQLKIIKRLIKEKRFQEAKKIVERFPDYKPIQSQMLKIAIKEGDLKRAKEIGERFPKDVPMQ